MADVADEQLATVLRSLGSAAETVVRSPGSTIEPPREVRSGRKALEVLQSLTHDDRSLVNEGVLGQGAMGVVQLARQVALDRQVAVKTLKDRSVPNAEALLSEAMLAGSLEHPGILPIYALSLAADGTPLVVMKRIEGVTWAQALRDDTIRQLHAPGRSRLEAHLRIAAQLCNAVHFAHSRQVIHRDLKPDNVMLGRFGEVYLVDWGIATAPGPSNQFAGTPAYMAPEMMGLDGATLSPATDVYLLGAILFEVVTGHAPHLAKSIPELVESVARAELKVPAEVPSELAELIEHCLRRVPSQRPANALEVKTAIEAFLEHQGSRELMQQSLVRAKELDEAIARTPPDPIAVARLFSECRFGFQQALRTWGQNLEAQRGLADATARMIRFELSHGSVKTARTLFAELVAPPPELSAAVIAAENAEAEKAREFARLHQIAELADPLTGSRARMIFAISLGAIWTIAPLFQSRYYGAHPGMDETMATWPVAVVTAIVVLIARLRAFGRSRAALNLQISQFLLFSMAVQLVVLPVLRYGFGGMGRYAVQMMLAYWFFVGGTIAATLVREVWPTPVGFLVALLIALWEPELRYEAITLGNLVLLINMVAMLLQQRRQLRDRASGRPTT